MSEGKSNENDIGKICQTVLPAVARTVRSASSLPSAGESYDFYQTYPAFGSFQRRCNEKIMRIIMDLAALNGRVVKQDPLPDDLVEIVLEANDQILEGVGIKLDEVSGINKNDGPILPGGKAPVDKVIVSSWNRKSSSSTTQNKSKLPYAEKVEKPQLLFREKPDNSIIPFVPKLFVKPHGIKPLPEQLITINNDRHKTGTPLPLILKNLGSKVDLQIYNHPYEHEIKNCGVPNTSIEVIPYKGLDETPLSIIESGLSLNLMIQELKQHKEIAVDLEHHSYRTYLGITCLMQISTRSKDFIIDTIALWQDLYQLNEIFADPKIVKVFHGSQNDIHWLQRDFGIYVVNLFDTFFAAKKLNFIKRSLDFLMQHYCKVRLDKKYQLADWRMRPLPPVMTRYARQDTHYLLHVFDRLRVDLEKSEVGATREVYRHSREYSLSKYEKPIVTETKYKNLYEKKNRKKFNSQQLEALRLLYAWRDQVARMEDESTEYVIPNHILLQIAEILPREQQGILACFSYQPVLVKQNLHGIHKLVKRARETPLVIDEEPAELSTKPYFLQETDDNDRLHDWSKEGNDESGIEEDLLEVKVNLISPMSSIFNFSSDPKPSKELISKEVNESFADPLNEQSIPYQLYLRPSKVDMSNEPERPVEKFWKVRPAAPLKEEKRDDHIRVERTAVVNNEPRISINEMKGKRKSEGSIPNAKKQRVDDDDIVKPHKFTNKDFKIFGQHKLQEKRQKGKNGKKEERKSAPGAPGYFTEPNFGKSNLKSRAFKNTVKSFTVKK